VCAPIGFFFCSGTCQRAWRARAMMMLAAPLPVPTSRCPAGMGSALPRAVASRLTDREQRTVLSLRRSAVRGSALPVSFCHCALTEGIPCSWHAMFSRVPQTVVFATGRAWCPSLAINRGPGTPFLPQFSLLLLLAFPKSCNVSFRLPRPASGLGGPAPLGLEARRMLVSGG
jgi:hypothetical protein